MRKRNDMTLRHDFATYIRDHVRAALEEDIGSGDLTAQLIPAQAAAHATVITRQHVSATWRSIRTARYSGK
jgi:nicotinate-nucleotide pyrophosphorylase